MPTLSDVLSITAVLIALASFGVSAHTAFHDRARLRIKSVFVPASEYGPDRIVVTMVNVGRRPVILRLIGGSDAAGHWGGTYLEYDKGGLRLAERERHEKILAKEDTVQFNPDGDDLIYEELWIEDSLGNRHPIPASRDLIKWLWAKKAK